MRGVDCMSESLAPRCACGYKLRVASSQLRPPRFTCGHKLPADVPYRTDRSAGVDVGWKMLHKFLTSNRTVLIDRCRVLVGSRSNPKATEDELVHGIPTFLDQLIETLTLEQASEPQDTPLSVRNARGEVAADVGTTAALHGRDLLLKGFTIEQVVRDYGDVCQAVTNLAVETGAQIEVDEFRTFNRCLDNAIAGAVTEYAKRTPAANEGDLQTISLRLGPLAQELRSHLHTVILAVSTDGATAAVLDQSLMAMRNILDCSLG
jgi:hypothetical protein